jgi:hypothetical protein
MVSTMGPSSGKLPPGEHFNVGGCSEVDQGYSIHLTDILGRRYLDATAEGRRMAAQSNETDTGRTGPYKPHVKSLPDSSSGIVYQEPPFPSTLGFSRGRMSESALDRNPRFLV